MADEDTRIEDKRSNSQNEEKHSAMKRDVGKTSARPDNSDNEDMSLDPTIRLFEKDGVNDESARRMDVQLLPDDVFLRRKCRRRCASRGSVFGK